MLAKKANLNRCGFRCKAEVRQFCAVTKWRQMAITECKLGPFLCWASNNLIPTLPFSFKVRISYKDNRAVGPVLNWCCSVADTVKRKEQGMLTIEKERQNVQCVDEKPTQLCACKYLCSADEILQQSKGVIWTWNDVLWEQIRLFKVCAM